MVEITEDTVRIYDNEGEEVVGWVSDEWKEDPAITIAIANAIYIYYMEGIDELKRIIGRS